MNMNYKLLLELNMWACSKAEIKNEKKTTMKNVDCCESKDRVT